MMQLVLRIEKSARHRIVHERLAMLLEIGHLFAGQRQGHLLLLLQRLAFVHELVILGARLLVTHKCIDPLANRLHVRLVEDCLTKLFGLLDHRALFNRR